MCGYCITYTPTIQFLAAAAEDVDARKESTITKLYISPKIMPKNEGPRLTVAAAENWQQNKHNTPCPWRKTPYLRQSLDLSFIHSGSLPKLLPYRKYKSGPEPQFQPDV